MILVDSSIWIDHLRRSQPRLSELLEQNLVGIHPLVIQELACGSIAGWEEKIELLESLPRVLAASQQEALELTRRHRLRGLGLAAIDVHLLASALLHPAKILTRDAALARAARRLGVSID